jgi:hypothetical protein
MTGQAKEGETLLPEIEFADGFVGDVPPRQGEKNRADGVVESWECWGRFLRRGASLRIPKRAEKDWLEKMYHNHNLNFTTHHQKLLVALSPFLQFLPDII